MNSQKILFEKILAAKRLLLQLSIEHWLKYELFTWQWWIKFVYLAIAIFVWYKMVDRKRILEIVSYGLLVSLIATVFDNIGGTLVLWTYSIRLTPIGFSAVLDLVVLPIIYMLIFQYFPKWKPFIIVNILFSTVASFFLEPLLSLIGVYKELSWKHIYSFFLYILIAVFCKIIIDKLKYIQERNIAKFQRD